MGVANQEGKGGLRICRTLAADFSMPRKFPEYLTAKSVRRYSPGAGEGAADVFGACVFGFFAP